MQIDGRQVRRVLVAWLMDADRPLTVAALARRLEDAGLSVVGRPGKVVSDSLRWEVARGRVVRLRRGTYAARSVPRSTAHRIRREALAVLRGQRAETSREHDELTATAAAAVADLLRRRSA